MERRLAAILAADVVGYSRLMEKDEAGTLNALRRDRERLIQPKLAQFRGRIVKLMGDGLLAEFSSAVEAVQCAVELQKTVHDRNVAIPEDRRVAYRIGINIGDVVVEGGDIYGDGVNVAARLEAMATPGGICISGNVYEQLGGKVNITFQEIGERSVKNIAKPVAVWRWASEVGAHVTPKLTLPDKPSIAVLAFANMSADPDQEYFADGIVEEIITALSRIRWLLVIARNSSFTYKGRAMDVKQVGRELGVRYVLEGSVRKAGNRVRITGQLIDAETGAHLWADRFDGTLKDIFDLQDQVTSSVVGAIAPKLEQAEIERAKHKPTESLDAYDYYLRGMAAVHRWTREGSEEALSMFGQAIKLDPDFASAYGMAARSYSQRKVAGWMLEPVKETAEAERLAWRAAELGKDDALALATAGFTLAYVVDAFDDGVAFIDQALALNPNLAWAWMFSALVKTWNGEPEAAIECVTRAMRLSPQDVHLFNMQNTNALAHFIAGRYAEALSWAEQAARGQPNYSFTIGTFAACAAMDGRLAEAERSIERLLKREPQLRISDFIEFFPLRRRQDQHRWVEGLRKAGLPE
jgi:TolB-like protein